MLDKLNPASRYAAVLIVLMPAIAFVTAMATLVISSNGVGGVDWAAEAAKSGNAAAVVAANGLLTWIALYVLPITRKFGVGSTDSTSA
jgi:hypothetical protein